jgi:hypothetical protein
MSASQLRFPPLLQGPMEQGALTPLQAWDLDLELTIFSGLPWSPAGRRAKQRLELYMWETEGVPKQ